MFTFIALAAVAGLGGGYAVRYYNLDTKAREAGEYAYSSVRNRIWNFPLVSRFRSPPDPEPATKPRIEPPFIGPPDVEPPPSEDHGDAAEYLGPPETLPPPERSGPRLRG